jgi:hypothetical protein
MYSKRVREGKRKGARGLWTDDVRIRASENVQKRAVADAEEACSTQKGRNTATHGRDLPKQQSKCGDVSRRAWRLVFL